MAIVYRHRRLDTLEIFYIGIANDKARPYKKTQRNKWWTNIINKTKYEVEIIAKDLLWEDACELEILLIEQYGRKDLRLGNLVNMTGGGEGAFGCKWNIGRTVSEDTKERMRIAAKNTDKSLIKKRIDAAILKLKGVKRTEEEKSKMSKIYIANGRGRKILCLNNGVTYNTIKEASKLLSVDNIGYVCKGKLKQTKGLVFKYIEDVTEEDLGSLENRIKQLENGLE